jgi:1-pyrroline-5-carboxylate dehydrogenase
MVGPFKNDPIRDFAADARARRSQQAALDAFCPEDIPLVIDGESIRTRLRFASVNPCDPRETIARACRAAPAQLERAIHAAGEGFRTWSRTPPKRRAAILFRAATLMRRRRWMMNALMILEVGKSWIEADADTAEAVDFLEYYGREMLRHADRSPVTPVPGERNRLVSLPLGVGAVIAPWNFPNAILTGMTSAALVTGNTVIMKPASAAVATGHAVYRLLRDAGVPASALHFVPCSGGEIGDRLVDHPLVRFVSFTGSREIGTRIYARAARVNPGQVWLKRVIAEMGGKDAIIVDTDADLDAAAAGIVASAFGYQGQKCSACSRAIVVGPVHDRLLARVKARTEALRVGDVRDPSVQVGACVDEAQYRKVLRYIRIGKREGRLVAGGKALPGPGWFVRPTVFADIAPGARLSREEIFGPVLAFTRARSAREAIAMANDTDYGLTGAFFGDRNWPLAEREFHVGNLYKNRKCTGAWVGGHPFGGFKMSGTDSKAGGPDYLPLFLQAQLISEKMD